MNLSLYFMSASAVYALRPQNNHCWWWSLCFAACGIVAFVTTALATTTYAAPDCMTLREARLMHPKDHLYQHRGCWGTRERATIRKPKPMPIVPPSDDSDKQAPAAGNEIAVTDANAMYVYDWFDAPRERFVMFALKEDREQIRRVDNFPLPLPPEVFEPPVIKSGPNYALWILILGGGALLSVFSAYAIHRLLGLLPPRSRSTGGRRTDNATASTTARSDRHAASQGSRETAGSARPRDQQPRIHSRDFYDWSGRAYERGHADHLDALSDRRDDSGALGAWARARGLRPENTDQHNEAIAAGEHSDADRNKSASAGWFGRRFAKFASR